MDAVFGVLCTATIFFAIVTVVGHGLWVLLAALFKSNVPEARSYRPCASCGAVLAEAATVCHQCGRHVASPPTQPPGDEVAGAIRQLQRLHRRGLIDATELNRLTGLLRMEVTSPASQLASVAFPASTPQPSEPFTPVEPKASSTEQEVEIVQAESAESHEVIFVHGPTREHEAAPQAIPPIRPARPPAHALDRDYVSTVPQASAPRQAIAELLKSFMAEKNIRWGEVISGMLIVGSAIGLVVSLRATLSEAIPYFPALIFMLITLGIHGAGIYTLRRWDLRSTSQGVLTIAMLLTPLNFLAAIIISGSEQRAVTDPMYLLAVAVGLAVVGWVTFSGGRALVPGAWWRLTAVIGATSIGQLIIDRQMAANSSLAWTSALAALPIAGFLLATVSQLGRAIRWHRISAWRANQMLLVLGIATFALLPPLGLLVAASDSLRIGVAQIAPAFSLAAAVILATGLLLHRRVLSTRLVMLRTAGTALALVGAMLMAAAVVLAWPETDLLIAVGLTNFAILVAVAVIGRLPVLHIAAVACLALAVLVGFHTAQGSLPDGSSSPSLQLLQAFATGRSALVLSGLGVLVAVVAGMLDQAKLRLDALNYLLSAAGLAVVSVLIAAFAGFGPGGDTYLATPVFAFYAIVAIAAAKMLNRPGDLRCAYIGEIAAWSGSGLLLAALVHGLWLNQPIVQWLASGGVVLHRPVVVAALLHAGICAILAVVFAGEQLLKPEVDRQRPLWTGLVNPLVWSALAVSTLVLPASLSIQENALANNAAYLFATAFVWLLTATLYRRAEALAVFQVLMSIGIAFLLASFCRNAQWGQEWWADPRHIQIQLIVLSVWCLLWSVLRRTSLRWRAATDLLNPPWPGADETLLGSSLLGLAVLAVWGCWPGVMVEMGATQTLSVDSLHVHAYGGGSWIALAVIAITLLVPSRDRWCEARLVGLLIVATVIPLLISARWESVCSTVSALHWTFAIGTLATAAICWLRKPIGIWLDDNRWLGLDAGGAFGAMRDTALLLGGLPVVLLTSVVVWRNVVGLPLGTPDDGTLFSHLSVTLSFAVPLLTLVAVLLGHALRERRTGYALAGSVLLQYVICLAYMLRVDGNSPKFLAGILQWNAVALAGYALLWLGLKPWLRQTEPRGRAQSTPDGEPTDPPLTIQMAAMLFALLVIAIWSALSVFLSPAQFSPHVAPLGGPASYIAWGLGLVAAVWCLLRYPRTLSREPSRAVIPVSDEQGTTASKASPGSKSGAEAERWAGLGQLTAGFSPEGVRDSVQVIAYFALALVALVAVSVEPQDNLRHWLSYHVLSCGWLAVGAVLTAASFRWQTLRASVTLACVLVTVLALRGSVADPSFLAPWWSVGTAGGVFVLTVILALRSRSQWFAYGSIVPLILATSFYWIGGFTGRWPVNGSQAVADFVQANLIALVFFAILWLLVDLWYQRKERPAGFDTKFSYVPVHVTVAMIGLILSAIQFAGPFCINSLARNFSSHPVFDVTGPGGVAILAGLGSLLIGALWEVRRSYGLPCLYVWGLVVIAFGLDRLQLPPRTAFFAVGMAAAGYVMLTGLAWRQGVLLAFTANSWGIRDAVRSLKRTAGWLPGVNLLIAAASMLATLAIVLSFPERWMRISSGMAPVLLAVGLAALAQKQRRTLLEYASLLMTGIAAVCLSWADLEPQYFDRMILLRLIRLLVVSAGLTFVYSVLVARLVRLTDSWMLAVRRIAVTFGIGALLSLVAVLFLEAVFFKPGIGSPIDTPQMLAVIVVLVGLTAGFISLALLPGRDPFTLSERGRMGYVYAAELVAALIFAHIYLCCPWIFHGFMKPYWPYIVMGVAFAAVGVGELFRRTGIKVLSEPLQHTSAFLPLLPALGIWVIAAEQTHYATLLFVIGLMYLLLSGLRRSVASGLAAALAGNAALWSLLTDADVSIWNHPQFWLIPPAVSALIAGQINQRRLTSQQLAGLRYAAVLVIYLSSTSEIFLQGIGQELWPPMVLAGLSVAGFFLGIILRVRSFLYLGTSFVLLSVTSMVWHAHVAIQHSWPLWAFGIGLGLCILVLFGVFEKQRPQLTAWVERIQQWEN